MPIIVSSSAADKDKYITCPTCYLHVHVHIYMNDVNKLLYRKGAQDQEWLAKQCSKTTNSSKIIYIDMSLVRVQEWREQAVTLFRPESVIYVYFIISIREFI